jgi:predicted ATP-grasp superfamily ATP-dependent carboligase
MKNKHLNPALIFGLSENGLAIGRSLAKKGIKVYAVSYSKGIAYYSKFIEALIFEEPTNNCELFKKQLSKFCLGLDSKPVLFITSDVYLHFIINNKAFIDKYFAYNLSSFDLIKKLQDKDQQYRIIKETGIALPVTHRVTCYKEYEEIKKELHLPVFIKGLDVNQWRSIIGANKKGFKIENEEQLDKKINHLLQNNVSFIIQELIIGNDYDNWKVSIYSDRKGAIKSIITLQKIFQHPIYFGVGSIMRSRQNKDLQQIGVKLFSSLNYKGVGSAEFKFSKERNEYVLIEINTRYWQQNLLALKSGLNFPLLDYYTSLDIQFDIDSNFKENVYWINLISAINSLLQYVIKFDLKYLIKLPINPFKIYFSIFSFDDIKPSIINSFRIIFRVINKLIKK